MKCLIVGVCGAAALCAQPVPPAAPAPAPEPAHVRVFDGPLIAAQVQADVSTRSWRPNRGPGQSQCNDLEGSRSR